MTLPMKKQENTSLRKRAGPGQLASTERLLWAKGRACLGSSDEGVEVRRVPSPSTGAPLNAGGRRGGRGREEVIKYTKERGKNLVPHPPPVILHERVFILALISVFPLYCEYTSRKNV